MLNVMYKDVDGMYPLGLEAEVLEYGAGAIYKIKLSTGGTCEWSENLLSKVFVKKPFKKKKF